MNNIVIASENWLKYLDSVGDTNLIHRSLAFAQRMGLEGVVAPGMFVSSCIQGGVDNNPSVIKVMRWPSQIMDGDDLIVERIDKMGRGAEYNLRRGGEKASCEIIGVKFGGPEGRAKPLGEVIHTYSADMDPSRIALYLSAIGREDIGVFPNMYLASLSAPAIFTYAIENGFEGIHSRQSFKMHEAYEGGAVEVKIGDRVDGKGRAEGISNMGIRWVQGDKIIASGDMRVLRVSRPAD